MSKCCNAHRSLSCFRLALQPFIANRPRAFQLHTDSLPLNGRCEDKLELSAWSSHVCRSTLVKLTFSESLNPGRILLNGRVDLLLRDPYLRKDFDVIAHVNTSQRFLKSEHSVSLEQEQPLIHFAGEI